MELLPIYSDDEDTLSFSSDVDNDEEINPLEKYGFSYNRILAGSKIVCDKYTSGSFNNSIPNEHFMNVVNYVYRKCNNFRNIVFMIASPDGTDYRYISFNKDRIDKSSGLDNIMNRILNGELRDMFESYDDKSLKYVRETGYNMNEFVLCTSRFDIVHNLLIDDIGGGSVIQSFILNNIKVENIIDNLYGPYDCFFECISKILGFKIDVLKYRERMKAKDGIILLKRIRKFERLSKIKIIVYEDVLDDDGNVNILYKSDKIFDKTVELVLHIGHYMIYKGLIEKSISNECKQISDNFVYIFYDFETYMDPKEYIAIPYVLSYYIISKHNVMEKGCIIKTSLKSDDIQTFNKSVYTLLEKYLDFGLSRLIGFNNGAFDDYILIDILSMFNKKLGRILIDRTSRILSFKYGDIVSKDCYRFIMCSLKMATDSFKCKTLKGNLDHKLIQRHVNNNTFDIWIKDNISAIEKYSISDVISLAELYFKMRDSFMMINKNLSIDNFITLSQMSMVAFTRSLNNIRLPILSKHCDDIIRQAIIGGRCQIFNACEENSYDVQSIDVVSLYPYVMMNRKYLFLDDNSNIQLSKIFVSNKIGVYKVIVESQPKDKIIPYKELDGTLNWNYDKPFIRWIDSITLNCLLRYDGTFSVIEGIIFDSPMGYIFENYLNPIMEMKIKQDELKDNKDDKYNPALRECLKLAMNSLSGKMLQKPIDKEKTICLNVEQIDRMINLYGKKASVIPIRDRMFLIEGELSDNNIKIKTPTIIGIMIYAYAREYMYDNFISKIEYKYGTDTDSLFLRSNEIYKISEFIGNKAGQVRLEMPSNCSAIFVTKKIYAYYTNDEIIKFKFKGVNKDDKIIGSKDLNYISNLIDTNNYTELSNIWDKLDDAYSLSALRLMLHNKTINILCSQIVRNFSNKDINNSFIIRGRFIIKKFPQNTNFNDLF